MTSQLSPVAISLLLRSVGTTHACGGTLDLLMTDVPDQVRIAVVAPIGNSDHSSLSAVISMAQWKREHLSLLVGHYVPTKVSRLRNKDKPWFDDQCMHAFRLKQEAHLRWTRDRSRVNWEKFVHYQVRANETYSEVKHQLSDRNRDVLMNVQSPHN